MAPSFTHLKALSTKIDAKIDKVKSSMHKSKAAANQTETITQPKRNEKEAGETIATPEPNQNGEEAQETMATTKPKNNNGEEGSELVQQSSCDSTNKDEKTAKRQARREARKAKWAARRATFKAKSKKVGEALFLPTAVVLGVICSPVILVVDAVLCIFKGVIWVVVKIVDTVCCGPVLVCFLCKKVSPEGWRGCP